MKKLAKERIDGLARHLYAVHWIYPTWDNAPEHRRADVRQIAHAAITYLAGQEARAEATDPTAIHPSPKGMDEPSYIAGRNVSLLMMADAAVRDVLIEDGGEGELRAEALRAIDALTYRQRNRFDLEG